jgi:hypothetical protein
VNQLPVRCSAAEAGSAGAKADRAEAWVGLPDGERVATVAFGASAVVCALAAAGAGATAAGGWLDATSSVTGVEAVEARTVSG